MENEKLSAISPFNHGITYVCSNDLLADSRNIIESARKTAYRAVDTALIQRNWLLGKRIAQEHVNDDGRIEYGKQIIQTLADRLTETYGKGFDFSNLYKYLRFYNAFPILDTVCPKSGNLLSWSHYRTFLQVNDPAAREWYLNEAAEQTWSVRTLQRNISSQYLFDTVIYAVPNKMRD